MKRLLLSALISATTLLCGNTFAGDLSKLYVDQQATTISLAEKMLHPYTDITVITASLHPFYITVPGTSINTRMQNGSYNTHIHSDSAYNINLVLKDVYQTIFFNAYVCPLAIVTVYGLTGSQVASVDSDLCN